MASHFCIRYCAALSMYCSRWPFSSRSSSIPWSRNTQNIFTHLKYFFFLYCHSNCIVAHGAVQYNCNNCFTKIKIKLILTTSSMCRYDEQVVYAFDTLMSQCIVKVTLPRGRFVVKLFLYVLTMKWKYYHKDWKYYAAKSMNSQIRSSHHMVGRIQLKNARNDQSIKHPVCYTQVSQLTLTFLSFDAVSFLPFLYSRPSSTSILANQTSNASRAASKSSLMFRMCFSRRRIAAIRPESESQRLLVVKTWSLSVPARSVRPSRARLR